MTLTGRKFLGIAALAVAITTVFTLSGCGGGGGGGASSAPTVTSTGGTVPLGSGLTVTSTAGAVQNPVQITAQPTPAAQTPSPPSGTGSVPNAAYTLQFSGTPGTITSDVTLAIPFSALPTGETSSLAFRVYQYNSTTQSWTPLPNSTVSTASSTTGSVSASIATPGQTNALSSTTTYAIFDDSPVSLPLPQAKS